MNDAVARVFLCASCRRGGGDVATDCDLLRAALAEAGLGEAFRVASVDCMGGCAAPVSVGFQGPGRATYLFNGVTIGEDRGDIIAFCRAWLAADAGWIEDARPLGRLRFCLRARVPWG